MKRRKYLISYGHRSVATKLKFRGGGIHPMGKSGVYIWTYPLFTFCKYMFGGSVVSGVLHIGFWRVLVHSTYSFSASIGSKRLVSLKFVLVSLLSLGEVGSSLLLGSWAHPSRGSCLLGSLAPLYRELPERFLLTESWREYGHWKNSSQALAPSDLSLASMYSSRSSLKSSGMLSTSR